MKTLIVDDSAMMRQLMRRALGRGVEVIQAADGMEALALLDVHGRSIDVILCDMNMPRVNGLSLLRSLRGSPELCSIPFVVVTADSSDESVRQAQREGACHVLAKPFRREQLAELIQRLSQSRERSPHGS